VSNPPPGEVFGRLERSLEESLERMKLSFVDLFFLHGYLVATDHEGGERRTPLGLFAEAVLPAFERLAEQGRIGAWGITAVGIPGPVLHALGDDPAPRAVQAITNPLDSAGEMYWFNEPARPRDIIAAANGRGIGVSLSRSGEDAGQVLAARDAKLSVGVLEMVVHGAHGDD
jgi:aryl-alcohol dehydrogenase-like predicted oxidoreductase